MTSAPDSDQELLERIRAGDQGAFERLFRAHYAGLLRFARAQLGDTGEAEDVVHDVFSRVWSERERLGGERSPRTYLLAAVRNRVIDRLRRRRLERRWVEPLAGGDDQGEGERLERVPDSAAAADPASLSELEAAIRRAVADLPERCRAAFLLCRDQGMSYAEAAEVMQVTPATVKTQMARALGSLRVALEPFLALVLLIPPYLR